MDSVIIPPHSQLLLPLLEVLQENGGELRPKEAAEKLCEKAGIPLELLQQKTHVPGAGEISLLQRRIRWTRQTAVAKNLIEATTPRNLWRLSQSGKNTLFNAAPGTVITIYETPYGKALWAEAESALGVLQNDSIQLILTSPPYPLVRKKEYQKGEEVAYLEWLTSLAKGWKDKLTPSGSLVLNLADCWQKGSPTMSLYQEKLLLELVEKLGYHFIQRLYWHSPSKIPSSHWVTIKRCRLNHSVEHLFWLGKSEDPKVRLDRVLKPYGKSMQRSLAAGGDVRSERPSTHGGSKNAFSRDRGGAIPFSLQSWTHAASQGDYFSFCREGNLPIHPARYPKNLPEFCIKMLTDPEDLVYDPFSGSNTTGATAEALQRPWISSERSLKYLQGSLGRFLPTT